MTTDEILDELFITLGRLEWVISLSGNGQVRGSLVAISGKIKEVISMHVASMKP